MSLFDVLGRRLMTFADGALEAGQYDLPFDVDRLPAGAYVVRAVVRSGGGAETLARRLTVAR